MPSGKYGSTNPTLNFTPVRTRQLYKLVCKKCRTKLSISQPNVHRPYQFLAVCAGCEAWYRVESRPGDPYGVVVELPEVTHLLWAYDSVVTESVV